MVYTIHITGASGYIASNFIYKYKNELLKNKIKLYDLVELPEEIKEFNPNFIKGNISETFKDQVFNSGDIILNFASYSHVDFSFNNAAQVNAMNCTIGDTIRKYCLKNRYLRLIHISTDEVTTQSSPYSKSKAYQEERVKTLPRYTIIRLNNVYGNSEAFPIIQNQPCLIPNTIKNKCLFIQGDTKHNSRNFLHIEYVCGKIMDEIKKMVISPIDQQRTINFYAGIPITVGKVQALLKNLFIKYNIKFDVKLIKDRPINDKQYPSDEPIENMNDFKYHLEETFKFILFKNKQKRNIEEDKPKKITYHDIFEKKNYSDKNNQK